VAYLEMDSVMYQEAEVLQVDPEEVCKPDSEAMDSGDMY
jgi:hypothetical protein